MMRGISYEYSNMMGISYEEPNMMSTFVFDGHFLEIKTLLERDVRNCNILLEPLLSTHMNPYNRGSQHAGRMRPADVFCAAREICNTVPLCMMKKSFPVSEYVLVLASVVSSTCRCEVATVGCSLMNNVTSRTRTRLTDELLEGCMRIATAESKLILEDCSSKISVRYLING
jgi:hypothetical protein